MRRESAMPVIRPTQDQGKSRDVILLGLLLAATGIVFGKDITVGGLRHGDSSAHAMDGVLIHDWIAQGPSVWTQPMVFATEQYAHYPTLGIGRHYPPGFAIVEAAFFTVFGVSPISARLCVVFFALLATAGLYVFARQFADRPTAALCALSWMAMPAMTRWGRQVMLEIPTLAMLIWGAIAFVRYASRPTWGRLLLALLASVVAILFKQTAVFFIAAVAVTMILCGRRIKLPRSHCVCAVAAAVVCAVGVALSLDGHGSLLLRGDATVSGRWSWEALTFYGVVTPRMTGKAMLVLAAVGSVVVARRWGHQGLLLGCWFAASYATLTLADFKNPRFLLLGLFPISIAAAVGASWLIELSRSRRFQTVGYASVATACVCVAFAHKVEHRPDYGTFVAAHKDKIVGRAVLFSGLRDGDFVFAVRQHIPWRKALVLRGSKLLYTCNGRPDLEFSAKVATKSDVEDLLRRMAFQSVFVERENKLGIDVDGYLRDYLANSDQYARTASSRFATDVLPNYRDTTLDLYEATTPVERLVDHFDVEITRAKRTVRVSLRDWS